MQKQTIPLNIGRMWQRLERLSEHTRPDMPWTRRAFSPEFVNARQWLHGEFLAAGLEVNLDAAGNLVGRRTGSIEILNPLVSGSHCDTVLGGGRFDGIVGVIAALEVANALKDGNYSLRHPFEVIDFLSEEPSDYGTSCVGSRALCGRLDSNMLLGRNPEGECLADAIRRIGGDPLKLDQPLRVPGSVAAFVELHIEQGQVLEKLELPIGVVTSIVGIRRLLFTVKGQPDHSGTTPMDLRRDALVGAACLIESTHRMASSMRDSPNYVVATVGWLTVTPNVPNAVPGLVEMILELRSDSEHVLRYFPEELMASCTHTLEKLGLEVSRKEITAGSPTDCTDFVMDTIEIAAHELDLHSLRMPSGAGHDAVYLASLGPTGMIFIPCMGGRSHCPQEWTTPEQLMRGTQVLASSLLALDQQLD